ncbi:MAG: hypothetical protein WD906_03350 [Anaerolineales bacterium]
MPEMPETPATPPAPSGLLSRPWLLIAGGVGACAVCGCVAVGLAFATGIAPNLVASLLPAEKAPSEAQGPESLSYEDRLATEEAQARAQGQPEDQSTSSASPMSPNQGAFETANAYAGNWSGSWTNQTFGSTGDVRMTIDVSPDGTATLTVDLDGLVFGLLDPEAATYDGSYTEEGAEFSIADDPVFGELSMVVDPEGNVVVSAPNVPSSNILSFSATGSLTTEALHLDYFVLFIEATPAQGVLDMDKLSP